MNARLIDVLVSAVCWKITARNMIRRIGIGERVTSATLTRYNIAWLCPGCGKPARRTSRISAPCPECEGELS